MRIHNGQDLLEICTASSAAEFLTDLIAPTEDGTDGNNRRIRSLNYSSGSSDEDDEIDDPLNSITISIDQLCRKLRKINHRFNFSYINENEEYSDAHDTAALSTAKR